LVNKQSRLCLFTIKKAHYPPAGLELAAKAYGLYLNSGADIKRATDNEPGIARLLVAGKNPVQPDPA
jgi:hypothetical protein